MNKLMKKFTALMLACFMCITMVSSVYATDGSTKAYQVEPDVTVYVKNPQNELSEKEVQLLLEDEADRLQDGDLITVIDVVEAPEAENNTISPQSSVDPNVNPIVYTYETTNKNSGSEYAKKPDSFVISVARGQVSTLTKKFSATVSTSITSGTPFLKSKIGTSMTASYSVSHKFKGPAENSSYNSREYRLRFYLQKKKWTQTRFLNGVKEKVRTGTAVVPTRYSLYSIDHKVK